MSTNNLRVISQNLVDYSSTTIQASSSATAGPVANLTKDAKSLVWRSQSASTTNVIVKLVVQFSSSIVGGIVLPFTNLTSTATIRVRGYTGDPVILTGSVDAPIATAYGTEIFDTGSSLASPYQTPDVWNGPTVVTGVNSYAYGGGVYGRIWIPINMQLACTSVLIEINDINPDKYIEISRLIIGPYWSPRFNTSFGLTNTLADLSTQSRTMSGDLVTNRSTRHSTMSFDLKWLDPADRRIFSSLLKHNGLARPMLISLFPNNTEDHYREKDHQIYGKLMQLPGIQQNIVDMYSSQIEIEEI